MFYEIVLNQNIIHNTNYAKQKKCDDDVETTDPMGSEKDLLGTYKYNRAAGKRINIMYTSHKTNYV